MIIQINQDGLFVLGSLIVLGFSSSDWNGILTNTQGFIST